MAQPFEIYFTTTLFQHFFMSQHFSVVHSSIISHLVIKGTFLSLKLHMIFKFPCAIHRKIKYIFKLFMCTIIEKHHLDTMGTSHSRYQINVQHLIHRCSRSCGIPSVYRCYQTFVTRISFQGGRTTLAENNIYKNASEFIY